MKTKKSLDRSLDEDEWFHILEFAVFVGGGGAWGAFLTLLKLLKCNKSGKGLTLLPLKAQFGSLPRFVEKGQYKTSSLTLMIYFLLALFLYRFSIRP